MAEGGLVDLQESLTCSVCTNLFGNPRTLPCQHVFCSECLHQYLEAWTKEGKVNCPLCRVETPVPSTGLEGFQKAFHHASQVEIYKTMQAQFTTALSSSQNQQENATNTVCKFHKQEMTHFCETCTQLICNSCSEQTHKSHKKVQLASAVVKHKAYLQSAQARLKHALDDDGMVQQAAAQAKKHQNRGIRKIQKWTEDQHKVIETYSQQLTSDITSAYKEFDNLIQQRKSEDTMQCTELPLFTEPVPDSRN